MKRFINTHLNNWKTDNKRKVLLLRGARQVGKTYSVREFGKGFRYFLEINFESDREVHQFFTGNLNPEEICNNLSVYYNIPITDGETLLFFDEIQACVPAMSSLRFFFEKRPGLHLVAAGSLLEFALSELPSFGLGRIDSLYMYPLSFDEFLLAHNEEKLYNLKQNSGPAKPVSDAFHVKLLSYLKKFMLTGGLPEVVATYIESGDLLKSQRVLDSLINGLDDDFIKYKKRIPVSRIREVFESVVQQSGNKFMFSKIASSSNQQQLMEVLKLLQMAGLVFIVVHTAANGLPLGAQINRKKFKVLIYDQGVFHRILGLDLSRKLLTNDFSAINKGAIAEQFVGLEIVKYSTSSSKQKLYYWHREKRGSNAEVDYITQNENNIVPIEVKLGTQGKMQSLHLFLKEKNIDNGVRISSENFCSYDKINVYPLYAVNNLTCSNHNHQQQE